MRQVDLEEGGHDIVHRSTALVRELQTLRDSLGLREVHLLGHSWGAMLAESYMATEPTTMLKSHSRQSARHHGTMGARRRLATDGTPCFDARDHRHARGRAHSSAPEYVAAANAYYALYMTRKPSRNAADRDSSSAAFGSEVYGGTVWGWSRSTPRAR